MLSAGGSPGFRQSSGQRSRMFRRPFAKDLRMLSRSRKLLHDLGIPPRSPVVVAVVPVALAIALGLLVALRPGRSPASATAEPTGNPPDAQVSAAGSAPPALVL